MKTRLLLLLLSLAFGSCRDIGVAPPEESEIPPPTVTEYYWAGGDTIQLIQNRKTVIGVYRPDFRYAYRWFEIIYFSKYQLRPLRETIASRGFNPDQFEWLSFAYSYRGGEILPTNRISFALNPGYSLHNLDTLIQNEAVVDSSRFGSVMLRVSRQDGNVFRIANKVHESGLVRYSTPDFIIRVTDAGKVAG
jgi:hypothetical protein